MRLCESSPGRLIIHTPAKINLLLRVLARRADGYHELETVMTTVGLYDTLEFADDADGRVALSMLRSGAGAPEQTRQTDIPSGPENIVVKAAELLQAAAGRRAGARIRLVKRIPSAAGLGGGSSDAAATLWGLNQFWQLGLPVEELHGLAAQLGSDLNFFLGTTPTALCYGRGEHIAPLTGPSTGWFVIVKPPFGLSTGDVFRGCTPQPVGISSHDVAQALLRGRSDVAALLLQNDLEPAARALEPRIDALLRLLAQEPVLAARMSGSGSSCFAWCRNRRQAVVLAGKLRAAQVGQVYAVPGGV